MLKTSFLIYPQPSSAEASSHIITDEFLQAVISEAGQAIMHQSFYTHLRELVNEKKITHLHQFDEIVTQSIKKANLSSDTSIAVGYIHGDVYLLKTLGQGVIYLLRDNESVVLIQGNLTASGYMQDGDLFLFTVKNFFHQFDQSEKILNTIHGKPIGEVEDTLNMHQTPESSGIITSGLFVQFCPDFQIPLEDPIPEQSFYPKISFGQLQNLAQQYGKKKTLTSLIVIVIICILVWSVGFGYPRRRQQEDEKKIRIVTQRINQKLSQAEEAAFLNLQKSISLLSEAKQDLEQLKKEVDRGQLKEVEILDQLIKKKEASLVKREEKPYEEFFDLAIDEKDAKGTRFMLDKDLSAILNTQKNTIYLLSLTKKTIEKKTVPEIGASKLFALFQNELFVFNVNNGISKISSDGKIKNIIQKDEAWGEISDISIYNGNIYLLDRSKDEVYKYLVAEGGYSGKNSYFKQGEAISLKGANSIAIDSSLYIGLDDAVYKYTAGARDSFKTVYPEGHVFLSKVFTTKDLENVYVWDKQSSSFYVLAKNGNYERQIKSSILSKADDVVFYGKSAFILFGSKIYKMNTE